MSEILQLDYYYGIEAEQFSFYRVPRLLIKDERFKKLSSDAKLLYGLMLDRMSLSIKNEWFDEDNRAYIIYTIDSIMEDLGCGKEKAVKVLAELDSVKGIGLVEKVRRGLGKPDIIYVKNFASLAENVDEKKSRNTDKITEVGKSDFKKSENRTPRSPEIELQEVGKSNFKKSEKQTSGSPEIEPQEVGESNPNYTNYNQTDLNYTEESYINPIIQSDSRKKDTMDVMEYKMGEHIGLLLVYELPDTVKQQRTEAQAYAAVWDIMMKLQKDLPRSFVYYGQDSLEDEGQRFDELGVFLPIHRFSERLEKSIDTVDKIVHAQA